MTRKQGTPGGQPGQRWNQCYPPDVCFEEQSHKQDQGLLGQSQQKLFKPLNKALEGKPMFLHVVFIRLGTKTEQSSRGLYVTQADSNTENCKFGAEPSSEHSTLLVLGRSFAF